MDSTCLIQETEESSYFSHQVFECLKIPPLIYKAIYKSQMPPKRSPGVVGRLEQRGLLPQRAAGLPREPARLRVALGPTPGDATSPRQ